MIDFNTLFDFLLLLGHEAISSACFQEEPAQAQSYYSFESNNSPQINEVQF